jgi:hypothetical protein
VNEFIQYAFASIIILLAINQFLLDRKLKRMAKQQQESRVLQDQKLTTGLKLSKAAYNKCKELEFMLEDDSTPDGFDERTFSGERDSESTTSA